MDPYRNGGNCDRYCRNRENELETQEIVLETPVEMQETEEMVPEILQKNKN